MSTTSARRQEYEESGRGIVAVTGMAFAGVMLLTVGFFQALEGLSGILKDEVYVRGARYTYAFDLTTWGWIHLVLGIIAMIVGIGVLARQSWAMIGGIVIGGLGMLSNFAFMPYYPFWAIIILALYAFVIWALASQFSHRKD